MSLLRSSLSRRKYTKYRALSPLFSLCAHQISWIQGLVTPDRDKSSVVGASFFLCVGHKYDRQT